MSKKSSLAFGNNYFQKINEKFSLGFSNLKLLKKALTHRSYINENPSWEEIGHNEKLEFLGDAILGFLTAEYLYKKLPHLSEGELSFLKSALTNEKILLEVAKELDLKNLMLLSKGEKENITENDSLLADAVEALIGALYLEKGIKKVKAFVKKFIFSKLKRILKEKTYRDSKSLLQEKTQMLFKALPEYQLVESWGPSHQKKFKVALYLQGQFLSEGVGNSLKEAETKAAERALKILEKDKSNVFKETNS